MSETRIPGIKAAHCWITDNCRVVQGGDREAFAEATDRLWRQYVRLCDSSWPVGKGASFHLALTVDYPRKQK